jgi:type I restriction enzyme R subunit
MKESIAEFSVDNPKLSALLTQIVDEIENDQERFLGRDISVIINQMRYAAIEKEIKNFSEKWYLQFEDVKYEAFNFRNGELANENKLKDSVDYAAYKKKSNAALSKIKFRKAMVEEFKNVLMPEIVSLL